MPCQSNKNKSILDNIEIAAPCPAKWEEMVGDERERFCQSCALNVYDISQMTKTDAEEFLLSRQGVRACVQLYKRKDGTIITDNCPKGLRAIRDRGMRLMKTVAGFLVFMGLLPSAVLAEEPARVGGAVYVPPVKSNKVNTETDKNNVCTIEQNLKDKVEKFEKDKKINTVDGARSITDLADFYKSHERLEESKKQYEKAIKVLKRMPEAKKLYDNAVLNKKAVEKQMKEKNK